MTDFLAFLIGFIPGLIVGWRLCDAHIAKTIKARGEQLIDLTLARLKAKGWDEQGRQQN